MHEVIITCEGGTPKIEVKGVKGKGCKDITADLEKALGSVEKSVATPEMREQPIGQQRQAGR